MSAALQALALTAGRPTLAQLREVQAAGERRALEAYAELLETDTRRLSFPESSRWFAAVERAGKTVARMIAEREKENAQAEADANDPSAAATPAKRAAATAQVQAHRQPDEEPAHNATNVHTRSRPTDELADEPTDEEVAAAAEWLNAAIDKHFPETQRPVRR